MIEENVKVRVRYSETDQMGFVYYGNYAQYLEIGRVAAMKKAGISYREMEEQGVAMPVRDMHITYRKAAKYDDEIEIRCQVKEMPSAKMIFYYQIYRADDILCEAETTLLFMNIKKGKLCPLPQFLLDKMLPFFS
ncbi:MAG: thioesterase family protein [Vicingaceae bacterium]